MTTVYLAWSPAGSYTLAKHKDDAPVDLLVAYPVLKAFLKSRGDFNVRRWMLDSGAFSAWNSGLVINLAEYIATCKDVDADEVVGLDVIRNPDATKKNLEAMWAAGVEKAIPTYHYGEPEHVLHWAAARPKIGVGGLATLTRKSKWEWIKQVFARVWPKQIHGFAAASWEAVRTVPFHSVDATSWLYAPKAMGHWAGYTGAQMHLRSKGVKDVWVEVLEHQKRGAWAEARWKDALAKC